MRAMCVILAFRVKLPLTLITRILYHSRKVDVFQVPLQIVLLRAHISTNVAFELSKVCSLPYLFDVVAQIELFSPFLTEILIACILVPCLFRGIGEVHHLWAGF